MTPISANSPLSGIADNLPNLGTRPPLAESEMQEVARQFESVFVSLLLKEMRQTLSEGLFGGDASDAYGGLFDMYMGQHLAESEALGIGQMVTSQYLNATQL